MARYVFLYPKQFTTLPSVANSKRCEIMSEPPRTSSPFILSIEPVNGEAFRHGFHLGTDLEVARKIAVEGFAARNKLGGDYVTRSVALIRDEKIVDVFDGKWSSEYHQDLHGIEGAN